MPILTTILATALQRLLQCLFPPARERSGAQQQHPFGMVLIPHHAIALQPLVHHTTDRTLDRPAANRQAALFHLLIVQTSRLPVLVQIGHRRPGHSRWISDYSELSFSAGSAWPGRVS